MKHSFGQLTHKFHSTQSTSTTSHSSFGWLLYISWNAAITFWKRNSRKAGNVWYSITIRSEYNARKHVRAFSNFKIFQQNICIWHSTYLLLRVWSYGGHSFPSPWKHSCRLLNIIRVFRNGVPIADLEKIGNERIHFRENGGNFDIRWVIKKQNDVALEPHWPYFGEVIARWNERLAAQ